MFAVACRETARVICLKAGREKKHILWHTPIAPNGPNAPKRAGKQHYAQPEATYPYLGILLAGVVVISEGIGRANSVIIPTHACLHLHSALWAVSAASDRVPTFCFLPVDHCATNSSQDGASEQ